MPRYTSIKIGESTYIEPRQVPGRGWCALEQYIFTVGLVYGITEGGKEGRYCYAPEDAGQAYLALLTWNGEGHPSGPWIRHKGRSIEESNPNSVNKDN